MRNTKLKRSLLILQILYGIGLAPWVMLATMSFLVFDQPTALAYVIFTLIWIYPLVFIGSAIASWILYRFRRNTVSFWINLLPLPWLLFYFYFTGYILIH
jgi:hypothetical protein